MAFEFLKSPENNGFEGSVVGMTLADLLQIKSTCHFTGGLSVKHRNQGGMIFMRDGNIIHAEQGDKTGPEAFYAIMLWKDGEFQALPKITTAKITINEPVTFLMLEAHRRMDEEARDDRRKTQTPATGGTPMGSSINTRLKSVEGVEYAVVLSKDGAPSDDSSYEGEVNAAKGMYLSMLAMKLGNQLGTGDFVSASVQGKENNLLLFTSQNHYLMVNVNGESHLGTVEADLRKLLTTK